MSKSLTVVALGIVLVGLIHDCSCRNVLRLPLTTKRPLRPKRGVEDEPLWLFKDGNSPRAPSTGDHPFLPNIIDGIHLDQNRRTARSVDSRDARRGGGGHSTSSGGKDTGSTHPGYNRRNTREAGDEPQWLIKDDNIPRAPSTGDHPFLPNIIDDIRLDQNKRTARSVDSRDARSGGGGHSTSSGGKDTGSTHPGYNRRNTREAGDEPHWLFKDDNTPRAPLTGDHPFLPNIIDDIHLDQNRRTARSVDSRDARRGGGGHSTSSGSKDTGSTHPGYNRRNTREAGDEPHWLFKDNNIPRAPSTGDHPFLPNIIDDIHLDQNRRTARSVDSRDARRGGGGNSTSSGGKDTGPTHPGFNRRNTRETGDEYFWLEELETNEHGSHERVSRDLNISGIRKPSYRNIIPNWNPNVRTNPWDLIGEKKH